MIKERTHVATVCASSLSCSSPSNTPLVVTEITESLVSQPRPNSEVLLNSDVQIIMSLKILSALVISSLLLINLQQQSHRHVNYRVPTCLFPCSLFHVSHNYNNIIIGSAKCKQIKHVIQLIRMKSAPSTKL